MSYLITTDIETEVSLVASAGQTVFSFDFPIFADSDLEVRVDDVLVDTYTVTGAGEADGGSITFDTPMAGGETVVLARAVAVKRTIDLPTTGPYSSDDIDAEFDRFAAILQQQQTRMNRSIRVPPGETGFELPGETARANGYLKFSSTGALETGPGVTAPSELGLSTGAAQIGSADDVSVQAAIDGRLRVFSSAILMTSTSLSRAAAMGFAYLAEPDAEGVFKWVDDGAGNADLVAAIATDVMGGIYLPPTADLTGASGAWVRRLDGAVRPAIFGNDIHAAAECAEAFGLTLMTDPVDYDLGGRAFAPQNIVWISNNSRLTQSGEGDGGSDPLDSVLYPGSNVKHIGRTYLNLADLPGAGAAYRAHVLCGRWDTGAGIENFHFDEFVFEGGHANCNGFSVCGDTHGIRGRRIDAGTSTKIGRAFMAHWGNFDEHYNQGGTYQHAVGAGPTTHPHDIVIDEVVGDLELSTGDFCALWCVSAGYDIHVGKVKGRCVNNGAGPGDLILFTAGDLGLAYASADELAKGMWGLTVGAVEGECSYTGVRRIGQALHWNSDSTPQPAENYFVKIEDRVGLVDVTSTTGSNVTCGFDGHNGRGKSHYGYVRAKNFRSAANFSNYNKDCVVDRIVAVDCRNKAIQLVGSGTVEADWPTNITIGHIEVNGTGLSEATEAESTATAINKIINLHIGTMLINKLRTSGTFGIGSFSIGADVRSVKIDVVNQPVTFTGQSVCVTNSAGADRFVEIGHISCPAALTPISGGATSRVRGRNRSFDYFGGAVTAGLTVRFGDKFEASSATSGQPWLSVVEGAGVTGSTAVVGSYLVRP